MKKIISTLVILIIAFNSFSQYYVYTAQTSGLWSESTTWTQVLRTDGVSKNKVVIPDPFTVYATNDVNGLGLGDVEIFVYGTLEIMPATNLIFSANSSIDLIAGTLVGLTASQKIKIGSDIKYTGNVDGVISGTYRVDQHTGEFVNMSMLPVNFTSFYIAKSADRLQCPTQIHQF